MRILEIHPLSEVEIEGNSHNIVDRFFEEHFTPRNTTMPTNDIISRILRGGYPEAIRFIDPESRNSWFSDYLLSILQREVREISHIGDLADMERLLRIIAVRTGQLLSPTALSSDIGIPKETLRRYFRILEQLYLVHVLPAWAGEAGRRYIKAPKLHINDTGLAAYELGADHHALTTKRDLLGNLLETFVVNEIRKQASWSKIQPKLYHLRTHGGKEIDLVLQARDGRAVAVEMKATASPSARDTNTLREVVADSSMMRGILFYTGEQSVPIAERVHALPIDALWG
jgi:predicted AAA+ superfamily ATPase